jgi:hypothetical protein
MDAPLGVVPVVSPPLLCVVKVCLALGFLDAASLLPFIAAISFLRFLPPALLLPFVLPAIVPVVIHVPSSAVESAEIPSACLIS